MRRTGSLIAVALLLAAAGASTVTAKKDDKPDKKFRQGKIQAKELHESSGLVASRRHEGVLWTQNDGGNAASLYAINREGKLLAEFPVEARNVDWEDLAIDDEGNLYIGEIGNNERQNKSIAVYRIREPDPRAPGANGKRLRPSRVIQLRYPKEGPFDAEALFVFGGTGYIIPKLLNGQQATLYSFPLETNGQPVTLEPVVQLPIRSPVTAAGISAKGDRLAVLTVTGPYVFQIDGDIANVAKVKPRSVIYINPKQEAIGFVDDGILVTTEDRDIFLFEEADFGDEQE